MRTGSSYSSKSRARTYAQGYIFGLGVAVGAVQSWGPLIKAGVPLKDPPEDVRRIDCRDARQSQHPSFARVASRYDENVRALLPGRRLDCTPETASADPTQDRASFKQLHNTACPTVARSSLAVYTYEHTPSSVIKRAFAGSKPCGSGSDTHRGACRVRCLHPDGHAENKSQHCSNPMKTSTSRKPP